MSAALSLPFDRQSQNGIILEALKSGRKLTSLDCFRLCGTLRASGRIFNLKHGEYDGVKYPIKSDKIKVGKGKRVALYSLERTEA